MDNITKEEYLEAVSKGAEKAFSWEIEGLFSPESAFKAVIVEGIERAVSFMLCKEGEYSSIEFMESFQKGLCNAIRDVLMKGEKPCKS